MSDLIDRESAIVRACAVIKDDYVAYDVVQALKALPSAQPEKRTEERTKTHECDLIDRNDAIMAVKMGALSAATLYGRTDEGSTALYETVRAIKAIPSAQPKRKTGKWIRTDMTDIVDGKYINWAKWNCSECGVVKKIGWAKGVNFCPNCGADMRGEQDD